MKEIIEFLEGVVRNEQGLEELEALRPKLNDEQNRLINVVLDLMLATLKYASGKTICAIGLLYEYKRTKDLKCLAESFDVVRHLQINPFLYGKLRSEVGISLSDSEIRELNSLIDKTSEESDKTETSQKSDNVETMQDLQQKLVDELRRNLNQN